MFTRRYSYNPLRGKPLLSGYGDGYLCPVPQLIPGKAGPLGIYFSGLHHFGTGFTGDLGHLYEQYIGNQLRLISNASLLSEITFTENRSEASGVDWIVIFDNLVLLVEVKSAIPTEPVRLGTPDAVPAITQKIEKAYRQIDKTANYIADRHPAFRSIPNNRPILGMAVTLEPFYLGNRPELRQLLPVANTSISLVDASDIEALVTVKDTSIADILLKRDADPERSTWALIDCLSAHERGRNSVLDAAWSATPWAAENRKDL